jgi:ribosome-associated protein
VGKGPPGGPRTQTNPSGGPRPRIKTSHEKLPDPASRDAAAAKRRTKTARESPRAAASSGEERGQGLRKARPSREPRETIASPGDRTAWGSVASESARETARAIAVAALDKKAVGLEILDVAGRVDYADFLVIMTGRSDRHAHALAQGIEETLKKQGLRPLAVEGLPHGSWVLMDFGDVVVHVFQDESRQLYDLEGLWLDARRLPMPVPPVEG